MSIINGVIKTLSSKFGITLPITVTSAVKDATTGESLDVTLNNINNKTDKIGNLSELPTTEKGSLVGAVTELNSQMFTDKRIATLTVTGSWSGGYDLGDKKLIQIVVLDGVPSIRTSIIVSKEALSTSCTSAKPYLLYNKSGGTIAQFYVENNKLYLFAYGGYIIHAYV